MKILGVILTAIVVALIIAVIIAFPIMLLWNWLMPALFGLGVINFWKALGLGFLTGILFNRNNGKN